MLDADVQRELLMEKVVAITQAPKLEDVTASSQRGDPGLLGDRFRRPLQVRHICVGERREVDPTTTPDHSSCLVDVSQW